eukprot:1631027-Rhodomonas_salina.1
MSCRVTAAAARERGASFPQALNPGPKRLKNQCLLSRIPSQHCAQKRRARSTESITLPLLTGVALHHEPNTSPPAEEAWKKGILCSLVCGAE